MKSLSSGAKLLSVVPGVLLAVIIGVASILAASFVGEVLLGYERSPISSVMLSVLIGVIITNVIHLPAAFEAGLTFAVKRLLRAGIVLLGIRLSLGQAALLGLVGIPIVVGCIAAALGVSFLLSRYLHLPRKLGTLIAVGTSICGVSAIVATAPVIGADDEEVAYAVSVITLFGLVATLAYPLLAHLLFSGDAVSSGMFLGTAIHDTSQVTGAGLVYSELFDAPEALNAATVTKLVRNLFMGIVIPLVAILARDGGEKKDEPSGKDGKRRGFPVPLFVIGFAALVVVRSIGDVTLESSGNAFWLFNTDTWQGLHSWAKKVTLYCLVTALAAVGLRIKIRQIATLGFKPFLAGLGAALAVGVVSFILVTVLGSLVQL